MKIGPRQFDHVLANLTVVVSPKAQCRGVGTLLFNALFDAAAKLTPRITRFELMAREGNAPPLSEDPMVRDRMAVLASEIEVGRQLMMQCAELAADGITPPEYGAISKVFSGELMERFGEAALDILGMRAALSEGMPGALDNGRFEQNLRHSLMWVISIGTNEIQRSLIAQRGLGLPR